MPKPTGFIAEIPHTVHGIPCTIAVLEYHVQPGNPYTWDSDVDYYGYTESSWQILDRKGYSAEWLEKKMTDSDMEAAELAIARYFEKQDYY